MRRRLTRIYLVTISIASDESNDFEMLGRNDLEQLLTRHLIDDADLGIPADAEIEVNVE